MTKTYSLRIVWSWCLTGKAMCLRNHPGSEAVEGIHRMAEAYWCVPHRGFLRLLRLTQPDEKSMILQYRICNNCKCCRFKECFKIWFPSPQNAFRWPESHAVLNDRLIKEKVDGTLKNFPWASDVVRCAIEKGIRWKDYEFWSNWRICTGLKHGQNKYDWFLSIKSSPFSSSSAMEFNLIWKHKDLLKSKTNLSLVYMI